MMMSLSCLLGRPHHYHCTTMPAESLSWSWLRLQKTRSRRRCSTICLETNDGESVTSEVMEQKKEEAKFCIGTDTSRVVDDVGKEEDTAAAAAAMTKFSQTNSSSCSSVVSTSSLSTDCPLSARWTELSARICSPFAERSRRSVNNPTTYSYNNNNFFLVLVLLFLGISGIVIQPTGKQILNTRMKGGKNLLMNVDFATTTTMQSRLQRKMRFFALYHVQRRPRPTVR